MNSNTPRDRMMELLADEALFGLSAEEKQELKDLGASNPDVDADALQAVAALIEVSGTKPEPMPEQLRQTILTDAKSFNDNKLNPDTKTPNQSTGNVVSRSNAERVEGRTKTNWLAWSGWVTAACLLLGLFLIDPRDKPPSISISEQRAALLKADDTIQLEWGSIANPEQEGLGDVVWSNQRQEGYMTFKNLPVNDPTVEQYQLWIFDEAQDSATPVDGGVFDVTDESETIVAMDPKLRVSKATMFAITVEKPGGVVVSQRERLPLLVQVQ